MTESTRIADELRSRYAGERLDPDARARVEEGIEERRHNRSPSPRRRLTRVAPAMAAVAGAAIAVTIALSGSESKATPVGERAAEALSAQGGIVRYRIRAQYSWGPLRRSTIESVVDERRGTGRSVHRDENGRLFSRTVRTRETETWTHRRGRDGRLVTETRRISRRSAPPPSPTGFSPDSLVALSGSLPDGAVAGPLRRNGREVYELTTYDSVSRGPGERWRIVYTADAKTFEPVRIVETLVAAPAYRVEPRPGARIVLDFALFEKQQPQAG